MYKNFCVPNTAARLMRPRHPRSMWAPGASLGRVTFPVDRRLIASPVSDVSSLPLEA